MTGVSYQIAHLLEKVGWRTGGSSGEGWRVGMAMVVLEMVTD